MADSTNPIAVGDPYITPMVGGVAFEFKGTPGTSYMALTDQPAVLAVNSTSLAIRVAAVPLAPTRTYIDQVAIAVGGLSLAVAVSGATLAIGAIGHAITVGLSSVKVDGLALIFNAPATIKGTLSVHWYARSDGTKWIDIVNGSWTINIGQDPGTNLALHPANSPLVSVLHLGLFVTPPAGPTMRGLLYDGSVSANPATYAAMIT